MTEQATKSDVRDAVDAVVKSFDKRFEQEHTFVQERHEENKEGRAEDRQLLQAILTEARRTNGRVTTLEANVKEIFGRLKDRVAGITVADVGRWVAIIGGTYFVMSALGFHK